MPTGPTIEDAIAAGNAACPGQPYYRYVGGIPDNYAPPADSAYPSHNLAAFIASQHAGPNQPYDVPIQNKRFGDSFNLQNTRGVCYAVIQYQAKSSNTGSDNDGLTIGHVNDNLTFTVAAQIINPANLSGIYAFDKTGLALLSNITGFDLGRTPPGSILDIYLQDDTEIDFVMLWIWYGPNCGEITPNAC
jgi:hypothetical protein